MSDRLIYIRLGILLVLAVFSAFVWLPAAGSAGRGQPYLQVHFLDVGQGDAIFIETPEGIQVLVDGGPDSSVLRALGDVMSVGDMSIDMVVGTHPDADHIGGLIDLFERYDVGAVLVTENESDSHVAKRYIDGVASEGADILYARRGQEYQLGASTTLTVLFPDTDPIDMESNTSSIVLQLRYGSTTFMLTGDSPKAIEEYLVLLDGEYLRSDVLKVGHHGSRTSTSELWLEEVAPEYAVISAGKNNRYGHPHVEVTDMLFNHGVETYSTAEKGTITFLSDGLHVWFQ